MGGMRSGRTMTRMSTLHGRRASALIHRWPTAVGLLVALAAVLGGADRDTVATTVAVAASCYVAAAAFSLPAMAWLWIPIASVLAVGGALVDLDPVVTTGIVVAVLVVVGLLRGASRPALTLESAGFVGYGVFVIVALLLAPGVGLVVAALTLVAHGILGRVAPAPPPRRRPTVARRVLRRARRPARPGRARARRVSSAHVSSSECSRTPNCSHAEGT